MDALHALHLRFDGPIPEDLRRAALAEVHAAPKPRVRFRVKAYTAAGQIDRMAEAMRFAARRGDGHCYRDALHEAGFSEAEIARYAADARALAARRAEAAGESRLTPDIPVTLLLSASRILRSAQREGG